MADVQAVVRPILGILTWLLVALAAALIGMAFGAVFCSLPYVAYGAESLGADTESALVLLGVGLGLFRLDDKSGVSSRSEAWIGWRICAALGVGAGYFKVVGTEVMIRPGGHNLAPPDLLTALVWGSLPVLLGALVGALARRKLPRPSVWSVALVTLALGLAAVSAWATVTAIRRDEAQALKKVVTLTLAQRRFRADNPSRGYACDLGELGERFSGPITKGEWLSQGVYMRGGVPYYPASRASDGAYVYRLYCLSQLEPQESFILIAARKSKNRSSRPSAVYCAGRDGAIRSMPGGEDYGCFEQGRVVHSLD